MNPIALLALPAIPALSALVIALFGSAMPYIAIGGLATVATGISFALALSFLPLGILGTQAFRALDLGPWLSTDAFHAALKLRLDSVGLCMVLLVTFFGFLITAYSVGYMRHDREQAAFSPASISSWLPCSPWCFRTISSSSSSAGKGWASVPTSSSDTIGMTKACRWPRSGLSFQPHRRSAVPHRRFYAFSAFGTISLSNMSAQAPAMLAAHHRAAAIGALPAAGRRFRQVRAGSAARVACRRHGRSHSGQRAHPCGHHGHRRHLSGDAPGLAVLGHSAGAPYHRNLRARNLGGGRVPGADANRHQKNPGLFHALQSRAHVPGALRRIFARGHAASLRPRLLQGAALPCGGKRHPGRASRAGRAQAAGSSRKLCR